jgi:hypothetical protein
MREGERGPSTAVLLRQAGAISSLRMTIPKFRFLDQAGAEAAEEVVGFGLGLGEDFGLIAEFERGFLEEKFDGVFGLEAMGDHLFDTGGEAVVRGRGESRKVIGAFVIAEFGRCQAVKSGPGFGVVQ